ncbi:MAG: helix-turn-helix domain-containing protein [Alistipes sp.]|nr:helix-turn-helix domain-containing protein [Alistipes sp.]
MKIGEIIRRRRKGLDLTQEQLAAILGVSAPAVNKWENGNSYPDITLLAPLARVLETDVNELLDFYGDLSEQEGNAVLEEISGIKQTKGFEAAFAKTEEVIRNYPKSYRLIGSLALIMNMWLRGEADIDKDRYENKIYEWLVLTADSNEEDYAESALIALCNEEIRRKDFDRAQEYLDRLEPKKSLDKRIMQANLFIEKGDFDGAYVLYEKKIFEEVRILAGTLSAFAQLKCKEKDYDTALRTAELLRIIGELFHLGSFQMYSSKLAVYADMQDADRTIEVLERIFADRDHLASQRCYLNEHIKVKNEKESEMLIKALRQMTEMKELDFLREDVRFKRLTV